MGMASATLSEPGTESYIASIKTTHTSFREGKAKSKKRNFAFYLWNHRIIYRLTTDRLQIRPQCRNRVNHRIIYVPKRSQAWHRRSYCQREQHSSQTPVYHKFLQIKNEKTDIDEFNSINNCASLFINTNKDECFYYIFSKADFTDRLLEKQEKEEIALVTLEEIYDANCIS